MVERRQLLEAILAMGASGLLPDPGRASVSGSPRPESGPLEIYPGAFQIASLYGGRHLFQYLFLGDSVVLFDSGIASTPEAVIFPAMGNLGICPEQITLAITSHADGDHLGGNHAIKQASPRTLLACGTADQEMVEDPQVLWDRHYNFLQDDFGVGIDAKPAPEAGNPQKIDLTFEGGEKIRIRKDWQLEVLHVPGHSRGHLALYDAEHKAAFISDAVHGRGSPKASGEMALPVTYYYVDAYLATISLLEQLPMEALYTAHFPAMRGSAIRDFMAESRQVVQTFDRILLSALKGAPSGLNLTQLTEAIGAAFSDWPKDTLMFAMFAIKGHMDRLEGRGQARLIRDRRPYRWGLP
jgi:glyoxylase-like metal-dependent hydrolase (beta-lactamase superfamily II)